jgi:two-component system LytT family response regulator
MQTDRLVVAVADDDQETLKILSEAIKSRFLEQGVLVDLYTYSLLPTLEHDMSMQAFDLLFLDIEMPEIDGISFGKQLRQQGDQTAIIFVSNREDRVFEAFESRPYGFVRKSNFEKDLSKVLSSFLAFRAQYEPKRFVITNEDGQETISIEKIAYIEGSRHDQLIHLVSTKDVKTISSTMEKIEEELEGYGFIPCYKGILVNFRYISLIKDDTIILTDGSVVPLSRRKASETKKIYLALMQKKSSIIF